MGIIFLGEDELLGRKAAVKLLGPDRLNDPKAEARFRREAIAAARLKHPNIAALYEMGEHDNKPFLAIEWVEGDSLEEILQKGPLPVERAMKIIEQVLLTLDYAHGQGVVHRDVKPANLMISGQDHVTLVDFGLAFLLSEPGLTSTGVLFGTPLYLAPEMAGDDDVDGRADLYSASLVLFEMLAGSPPFPPAPPAELISQHLHASRPVLSESKPDLPAGLDPVLQKAMARDRNDRYPDGASFLLALRQAVGAAPPPPRPVLWPVVASVLSLAAIGLWLFAPRPLTPPRSPIHNPTPIATPATEGPDDWTQVGGGPDRSYQLSATVHQPEPRWNVPAQGSQTVLVAEGKLVVAGPSSLAVLDALTGKQLWRLDQGGVPLVYTWDDPSLILLNNGKLWRALTLTEGKEIWKLELPAAGPGGVLADDGYVYAAAGSTLVSFYPKDGSVAFTVELGETVQLPPVARNAGAFLALKSQVVAVDSFSEKVVWRWKTPHTPTCLTITPDDTVVVGCSEGEMANLPLLSGDPSFEGGFESAIAGVAAVQNYAAVLSQEGEVGLLAMPSSGDPYWKIVLDEEAAGPPLTDGAQVLVTTRKGEILSLQGGLVEWRLKLAGTCQSVPVPAGDWLYVLAGGKLSAYFTGGSAASPSPAEPR